MIRDRALTADGNGVILPMMSRGTRRPRRWPVLVAAAALTLAGCGISPAASHSSASGGPSSGRPPAAAGLTQERLRDALLPVFQRLSPAVPGQTGSYASSPTAEVAGVAQIPAGSDLLPKKCAQAIWSGPDPKRFGNAASAVLTLHDAANPASGVHAWDALIAADGQPAQAALGTGPIAGCGSIHVRNGDRRLTVEEQPPPKLGAGSRGIVYTPSSADNPRTWVVTFVGNGYVGVVYMQGRVTKSLIDAFASAVYEYARQKLG
jgi:hypothetical protein